MQALIVLRGVRSKRPVVENSRGDVLPHEFDGGYRHRGRSRDTSQQMLLISASRDSGAKKGVWGGAGN